MFDSELKASARSAGGLGLKGHISTCGALLTIVQLDLLRTIDDRSRKTTTSEKEAAIVTGRPQFSNELGKMRTTLVGNRARRYDSTNQAAVERPRVPLPAAANG